MNPTVADINPKTLDGAKRQFVELYGSALVMNTYLKIAVVLLALVALGLVALNFRTVATYANVKPLVVRIDEVGRAEAVQYDATAYQPQPPELRYFLTQFVVKHFSRIRSTVQREYPDSLFFLEPTLADATIAQNDQTPCPGGVPHQSGGERGRYRCSERQPDGGQDPAVQGSGDVSEAVVHVGYTLRTGSPNVRGPDRLRD